MKVKVEFRELSNSVTAAVDVEGDDPVETMRLSKELFTQAQLFSMEKTMRKIK